MNIFNKRKTTFVDPVEERFEIVMGLIKDLEPRTYKKLKEGMDLGYQSYQKIRDVKTPEEKKIEELAKENEDIDLIEKSIEVME